MWTCRYVLFFFSFSLRPFVESVRHANFFHKDPEVGAVAAQILSLLSNRLGELYNAVHSRNPASSLLQQIVPLSRALQDMYRRLPAN